MADEFDRNKLNFRVRNNPIKRLQFEDLIKRVVLLETQMKKIMNGNTLEKTAPAKSKKKK